MGESVVPGTKFIYFKELSPIRVLAEQGITKSKPKLYYNRGGPLYRVLVDESYANVINFLKYLCRDLSSIAVSSHHTKEASPDFDHNLGYLVKAIEKSKEKDVFFKNFERLFSMCVDKYEERAEEAWSYFFKPGLDERLVMAIASTVFQGFIVLRQVVSSFSPLICHCIVWDNGEPSACCLYRSSYKPNYSSELEFEMRVGTAPLCWREAVLMLGQLKTLTSFNVLPLSL